VKVLGIDPGLQVTGYAVIRTPDVPFTGTSQVDLLEAGVIRTPGRESGIARRLQKVHDCLGELIAELEPDVMVLERIYTHYKHPTTAILMGHARGVVCLLSASRNVPLVSLAPARVKKAITGKGQASKEQVQRMIQSILSLRTLPEPCDVADALAIALAYVFSMKGRVKGFAGAAPAPRRLRKAAV